MQQSNSNTDELVSRAVRGEETAMCELLGRHRNRLKRMVAVRMPPQLCARVDPSDVVQDVLAEAAKRLPGYASGVSIPFYPWLRRIAWERLVHLQRRHVKAQRRSIDREEPACLDLADESAMHLAEKIAASGTSPSGQILREELRERVRLALDHLASADREILVMRHLEQLQVAEIASILEISEGAVRMRCLRAVERMRDLLDGPDGEGEQ